MGVVKSLLEHNLLPKIICGSSVGALIAVLNILSLCLVLMMFHTRHLFAYILTTNYLKSLNLEELISKPLPKRVIQETYVGK